MVKIITDSASDIPTELVTRYDITVIPAFVWFGGEKYADGIDIEKHEFYDRLVKSDLVPRTTHASPRTFLHEFKKHREPVLAILTSKKLSPFYYSAELAVQKFSLTHVTLYDSETVSMGLGQLVLTAAKLIETGHSIDDVLYVLDEMKKKQSLFVLLDTLKYIVRGGRAKRSQEVLSNLLNIKPVLHIKDGELHPFDKGFGYEKTKEKVLKSVEKLYQGTPNLIVSILYSTNLLAGQEFYSEIVELLNPKTIYMAKVGPSVGSNVGPNALALAIAPEVKP